MSAGAAAGVVGSAWAAPASGKGAPSKRTAHDELHGPAAAAAGPSPAPTPDELDAHHVVDAMGMSSLSDAESADPWVEDASPAHHLSTPMHLKAAALGIEMGSSVEGSRGSWQSPVIAAN